MLTYLATPQQIWLLALVALWALCLFGGFLFGHESETHRTPRRARIASSTLLVTAAWSWLMLARGTDAAAYALMIAIGMSFGWLGDLILAGMLPGGRNVLGGIAAFGTGHIFYIIGIVRFANQTGLTAAAPRWGALLLWLVVAVVLWYVLIFRGQAATKLHWAALPYAMLLASTTGLAMGLALQAPQFWGLAIGAALFLFSDLVLAMEIFTGLTFRSIGDVVWLTYGPGQMLIVYSVGAALQTVG